METALRGLLCGALPLVKVCGLTRAGDVALCEELGVDWTGFIFHPAGPRNVDPALVASLPRGRAKRVGVFVDQTPDQVCAVLDLAGLDLAQLHGGQEPEFCRAVGAHRVIKVFWPQRYPDMGSLTRDLERFAPFCRAVLMDAGTSGGGHGRSLDFAGLRHLRSPLPWILAGGLGPANIHEALLQCAPDGVDLNSGVEDAPGRKNQARLARVMEIIEGTTRRQAPPNRLL